MTVLDDADDNAVVITGLGLLSALGEGPDAHFDGLKSGKPANLDTQTFAPYSVHALGEVDWSGQISRRDMRQMEPWQRIGTYAAGLALDDAGVKDNEELCGRMDMIVAAGGGERDAEVDASVLEDVRGKTDVDNLIAERLGNDLRPTLFLAQLSNLLAGNISIVHKVTGSSRTFMGEEGAGISAIQTAHARIASGQSDIMLVGGAFNGEREDMMLVFELGQYLAQGAPKPIWSREGDASGMVLASVGSFLILESAAHARERGARAYAEIAGVVADHGSRADHAATKRMTKALHCLPTDDGTVVLSGASGIEGITKEEKTFLSAAMPNAPARAYGSVVGTSIEAQFPLGIALAALAVHKGDFIDPLEAAEQPSESSPSSVLVTTFGHWRGEGMGLLRPVGSSKKGA
ncbi:beta-ketoacyl-ACP synthase [Pseudahrensia aquimaris]|uniref:Beta-ketoacyl-ACP synthase n=1 Tax=Pseudahrensia aquimaris TaxID=744461 RepID=A0ABW3FGZ5_9HYPH